MYLRLSCYKQDKKIQLMYKVFEKNDSYSVTLITHVETETLALW
jgi:hypothetical protein